MNTEGLTVTELRCALQVTEGKLTLDVERIDESGSTVLAQQAQVWDRSDTGAGDPGAALMRWVDHPVRRKCEPGDPATLPDDDTARQWGAFVGQMLANGVGEPVMDQLLAPSRPEHLVRLSFRALDPISARIPFETVNWPPREESDRFLVTDDDLQVSVVRVPGAISQLAREPVTLGGREPGEYRALVISSLTRDRELTLDAYHRLVENLVAQDGFARLHPLPGVHDFDRGSRQLHSEVRSRDPDFLIAAGHGDSDKGWHAGNSAIDGAKLAAAVAGGPSSVILAMCQSGTPRSDGSWAPSEQLARAGVPLTIGFQGGDAAKQDILALTEGVLEDLANLLLHAAKTDTPVPLVRWERAVRDARISKGWRGGVVPTMTVHPDLLSHRSTGVARPRPVARAAGSRPTPLTATPWYVPGQLVCGTRHGRALRIPVPVDAGVTLATRLGGPGGDAVRGPLTTTIEDFASIRTAWGVPSNLAITVDRVRGHPPEGWANRSAELSAIIRSLAQLLRERPPRQVRELLGRAVADDWGAHDQAPRAVDMTSGAPLRRFTSWPALAIQPGHALTAVAPQAVCLARTVASFALGDDEWSRVEAALNGDQRCLRLVAEAHQERLRNRIPSKDPQVARRLDRVSRPNHTIVVPGAASLQPGTAGEASARLKDVRPYAVDVPHRLS